MLSIAHWLNTIGLGQYAQHFAENCIDAGVLRDLTDRDLEKIGLPLRHRKKLLRAIRELADASPATPPPATASKPAPHDSAGRRQLPACHCRRTVVARLYLAMGAALSGQRRGHMDVS